MEFKYDFILFENYPQAKNHKFDVVLIARMLASQGKNVAILDVYQEYSCDAIEGVALLHLPFKSTIPNYQWQITPKNKLHSLFAKLRFIYQHYFYMKEVLTLISPLTSNIYAGSLFNLMSVSLFKSDRFIYFWGLRSSWLKLTWHKFLHLPVETLNSILLRKKILSNSCCKLFVSNQIIKDEFVGLGFKESDLVIREERLIEKVGPSDLHILSENTSFLVIGSLRKEKNIPLTVKAFELANIVDSKLFIVGKSQGFYERDIENAIAGVNNIARVNRRLDYSEFNDFFKQSHFVVFADNRGESCITNGTMMEALINHRPIICPNFNPYYYYINKYKVGLLYEAGDVSSYASALKQAALLGTEHFIPAIDKFLDTICFDKLSRQLVTDLDQSRGI